VAFSVKSFKSDAVVEVKLMPRPIHEIPFPAFTICSETKALQSQLNFTDMYHEFYMNSDETVNEFSDDEYLLFMTLKINNN
jgi:hypothetical protein